ncbi:hypothetical protein BGZ47_002534, partial [Haplosporangium gracile]
LKRTLVISSWNVNGVVPVVLPAAVAVATLDVVAAVTEEDSSAKARAAVVVAEEDELGGEGKEVYDRERTEEDLNCFEDSEEEEEKKKEEAGADPLLEEAVRVEEVKRDRVVVEEEDRLRRYDRSGDVVKLEEEGLEGCAAD